MADFVTARRGRPPFQWSPNRLTTLRDAIAAGGTFEAAGEALGISAKTIQRNLHNPDVAAAIDAGKQARPVVHGASLYVHGRCRCDICRAAHTDRMRAYLAARKAS